MNTRTFWDFFLRIIFGLLCCVGTIVFEQMKKKCTDLLSVIISYMLWTTQAGVLLLFFFLWTTLICRAKAFGQLLCTICGVRGVAVVPNDMNSSSFSLHKIFDEWNAYAPQVVLTCTTCIEGDHYDDIQFWSILCSPFYGSKWFCLSGVLIWSIKNKMKKKFRCRLNTLLSVHQIMRS